ncbi:hypothetical protein AH4AK4_0458 [Aeromonas hydrophila 4AK4]|nr:hypothetical protein AH4AK4_0458 [Aeromonas hydrophila 4AK4]
MRKPCVNVIDITYLSFVANWSMSDGGNSEGNGDGFRIIINY